MTQTNNLDNLFASMRDSEPYLSDNGFADTVTARLSVRKEVLAWQKNLLVLLSAITGSALAATFFPFEKLSVTELMSAMASLNISWVGLAIAAGLIAALCGGTIWASEREII